MLDWSSCAFNANVDAARTQMVTRLCRLILSIFQKSGSTFAGQTLVDRPVGFADVAVVPAETVLVESLAGGDVPEAGAVRSDVIAHHEPSVRQVAKLDLEVHQGDADLLEDRGQDAVDLLCQ